MVVTHYSDAFDLAAEGEGDAAMPPAWRDWLGTRHAPPVLAGGSVMDWADAIAEHGRPAPHTATPQDLAVLPYTSGTTGLPKGCMHPMPASCTTRWPAACGAAARLRT